MRDLKCGSLFCEYETHAIHECDGVALGAGLGSKLSFTINRFHYYLSFSQLVDKRYLRCPAAVSVSHIKKFIRHKFSLPMSYQVWNSSFTMKNISISINLRNFPAAEVHEHPYFLSAIYINPDKHRRFPVFTE